MQRQPNVQRKKAGRKPKNPAGPQFEVSQTVIDQLAGSDVSRETIVVVPHKAVYDVDLEDPLIKLIKSALAARENPRLLSGIFCDLENLLARKGVL